MPPHELEHPALDQLAATPEILRILMASVSDEMAVRKPAADRWSIAEVLEHLSHVEGHLFRVRLDRMLATDGAEVEPYDEKAFDAQGAYSGNDPEESFAHWEEQREAAVELIRTLDATRLARTGRHPEFGVFTVEQLLNNWVCHDLGHVRQITELVRAYAYLPATGPFQKEYKLNP
ncbi:MAG: DinB family protein [Acidobacteriota bacterium]